MNKLLVLGSLVVVIGLIIWWFFGQRPTKSVLATKQGDKQVAAVVVDGGYSPAVIELQRGIPAEITFTRRDTSACFDEVVLPDFGIRAQLPVGQPYVVTINPSVAGEYKYACGMNMFFGKVVVK